MKITLRELQEEELTAVNDYNENPTIENFKILRIRKKAVLNYTNLIKK